MKIIIRELRGQIALTEIRMKIVEYIHGNRQIITGESVKMFNISRQAVLRELSRLALFEVIKPEGRVRGAYYAVA